MAVDIRKLREFQNSKVGSKNLEIWESCTRHAHEWCTWRLDGVQRYSRKEGVAEVCVDWTQKIQNIFFLKEKRVILCQLRLTWCVGKRRGHIFVRK